jgi:hypothetical protein
MSDLVLDPDAGQMVAGLGGVPVEEPPAPAPVMAPMEAPPVAGLGEVAPPEPVMAVQGPEVLGPADPSPEEEAGQVRRSRSLGPRPQVMYRQAAPIEPPDLAATGAAIAQSATQMTGAGVAGAPMAAGSAMRGAGEGLATAPLQMLRIFDAVDVAEERGEEMPVGAIANAYRRLGPEGRAAARQAAGDAQAGRDAAGTGQGLQAAGRSLQQTGRGVFRAVDEFARETFPVPEEREADFGVRFGRAVGAAPPILAAGAVGGPAGVAAVLGSGVYANTFEEARRTLVQRGMSEDEADRRAADAATVNAFTQAGLMTVPFVRLLDRMSPQAQTGYLSLLRSMGVSGAEFSGSNAVGRVLENYLAREGFDPDREILREVRESLGPEFAAGAVLPFSAAAARTGTRLAREAAPRATAAPEVQDAARGLEERVAEAQEAGTTEARAAAEVAIDVFARETGLPAPVRVRLVDRLSTAAGDAADARYTPEGRLIEVALDTEPGLAVSRVFHEGAGHAILEFLPGRERGALERAADRWLSAPMDPERSARPGADMQTAFNAGRADEPGLHRPAERA